MPTVQPPQHFLWGRKRGVQALVTRVFLLLFPIVYLHPASSDPLSSPHSGFLTSMPCSGWFLSPESPQLPFGLPSPHLCLASLICPSYSGETTPPSLGSPPVHHCTKAMPSPQALSPLQVGRGAQRSCSPPRPRLEDT